MTWYEGGTYKSFKSAVKNLLRNSLKRITSWAMLLVGRGGVCAIEILGSRAYIVPFVVKVLHLGTLDIHTADRLISREICNQNNLVLRSFIGKVGWVMGEGKCECLMGAEAASAESLPAEHEDGGVDQMELHRSQLQEKMQCCIVSQTNKELGTACRIRAQCLAVVCTSPAPSTP